MSAPTSVPTTFNYTRFEEGWDGNYAGREVHVEVPTTLSAEQRRLLEEFARVSGDGGESASRSWFDKAKKLF
jgi:DnaJ-class molecular chaperone